MIGARIAGAFLLTIQYMTRLSAFFIHLLISLCLAGISFIFVFLAWYPDHLSSASGANQIFLMLLAIDSILGPCITLIIFNPKKKELKWDLAVIAIVQLSALLYGLHAMFIARPAYIVFNVDRFDVVYANDFSDEKLAKVKNPQFQHLPVLKPQIIAARGPSNVKERNALLLSAIGGGDDLPQLPQYYVNYSEMTDEVSKHAHALQELNQYNREKSDCIANIIAKYEKINTKIGFLPLKGKIDHLTVIVDLKTAEVLDIIDLKPW